ncbi:MAG: hypothetical protein RIE56_03630 [Amphiplicatus sp.]
MSHSLLLASAAFGALALLPAAAMAECAPDNPSSGQTVICAADDADGLSDGSNNVTVTVNAGVTVSSDPDEDAFNLDGDANTVNNSGIIDGDDEGVQFEGDGSAVNNFAGASIAGTDRGIDADGVAGITVWNAGTIIGEGSDAIRVGDGATITNEFTGTITGGDEAVQAGDNLTLINHGVMTADDEGVEADNNFTFTNTGSISSVDDAIQSNANAMIINSGLMESSANDAIDIDNGTVINTGTIRALVGGEDGVDFDPAVDTAIVSVVDNRAGALIEGEIGVNVDPANDSAQSIINAGTITGRSGVALFLEDGNDSLTLFASGVLNGTSDFGAGEDSLILSGDQAALVGGGALFDGGADADTVMFDFASANIVSLIAMASAAPNAFALNFLNADGSESSLLLANFEFLGFSDGVFDFDDFATVPLPASAFLFGGALALFGRWRRKSKRARN